MDVKDCRRMRCGGHIHTSNGSWQNFAGQILVSRIPLPTGKKTTGVQFPHHEFLSPPGILVVWWQVLDERQCKLTTGICRESCKTRQTLKLEVNTWQARTTRLHSASGEAPNADQSNRTRWRKLQKDTVGVSPGRSQFYSTQDNTGLQERCHCNKRSESLVNYRISGESDLKKNRRISIATRFFSSKNYKTCQFHLFFSWPIPPKKWFLQLHLWLLWRPCRPSAPLPASKPAISPSNWQP